MLVSLPLSTRALPALARPSQPEQALGAMRAASVAVRRSLRISARDAAGPLLAPEASVPAPATRVSARAGVVARGRSSSSSGQGKSGGLSPDSEESAEDLPVKKKRARAKSPPATAEREQRLWAQGFQAVCGVDEAGRGPLAGPVVAAACIIPQGLELPGVMDSKKLSEQRREELFEAIVGCPGISYAIGTVEAEEIDRINILQATLSAMAGSIQKLGLVTPRPVDYILVDGSQLPKQLPAGCPAEAVVRGDSTCRVIAAASILAKVTRDRLMRVLDREYPVYGFGQHKGYGTAMHMAVLLKHGPCPAHRRSFAPLKDWDSLLMGDASRQG